MDKVIITILDGVGPTSMPYNEFVLWRANHCHNERQILIVIGAKNSISSSGFSGNIELIQLGWNPFIIRKKLKGLLNELKRKNVEFAIHLHQLKSATITQLSMLGTEFKEKTIFTVHSTFTGYAIHNKIQSYFNGLMAKYVACVSNASYTQYPASLKKIKGDRVMFIRNGVDIDRIAQVTEGLTKKENNNVVFVYVARLIPLKNHSFLVEAVKNTDLRARFVFIGKDNDSGLDLIIKNAGLEDRITLTGLIPREEVFSLIYNSDVYLSSSTLEGMPISVLEAMCCGLPAILSNIPQHKEIGGSEDFVTYLPFEKELWINEINRYVQMSNNERIERGEKGKKYIEEHFSLQTMHQQYSIFYQKLQLC